PASIAGEPGASAWVWVGPPLSASGPSWAFWPMMSLGCWLVIVQPEVFPIRLLPCELSAPPQSGPETVPVLPARIDPFRFTVFPASGRVPPPFAAVLPAIVELRTLTVGFVSPT